MAHIRRRLPFARVIEPPPAEDKRGPTPERVRHAQGLVERGNLGRGRSGISTMRNSPIERALGRRIISQTQYTAAIKYRHHWYRAGLSSPLQSVELNRIFATDLTNFSGMAKTETRSSTASVTARPFSTSESPLRPWSSRSCARKSRSSTQATSLVGAQSRRRSQLRPNG